MLRRPTLQELFEADPNGSGRPPPDPAPPSAALATSSRSASAERSRADTGHSKSSSPTKPLKQIGTAAKHLAVDCFVPARSRPFNKLISGQATPAPPRGSDVQESRQTESEPGWQGPNWPSLKYDGQHYAPKAHQDTWQGPTWPGLANTAPAAGREGIGQGHISQSPGQAQPSQTVTTPSWSGSTSARSEIIQDQAGADAAHPKSRSAMKKAGRAIKHVAAEWFVPARSRSFKNLFSSHTTEMPAEAGASSPSVRSEGASSARRPTHEPPHAGSGVLTTSPVIQPTLSRSARPPEVEPPLHRSAPTSASAAPMSPVATVPTASLPRSESLQTRSSRSTVQAEIEVPGSLESHTIIPEIQPAESVLHEPSADLETLAGPSAFTSTSVVSLPLVITGRTTSQSTSGNLQSGPSSPNVQAPPTAFGSRGGGYIDTSEIQPVKPDQEEPPLRWQEQGPFEDIQLRRPDHVIIDIAEDLDPLHPDNKVSASSSGSSSPDGSGRSPQPDDTPRTPVARAATDLLQVQAGSHPVRPPRLDKTNRQDYVTAFSNHTRAGAATTLHRFAQVSTALTAADGTPPVAATYTPSMLSRMVGAVKRSVGLPGNVEWMKSAIRDVRADACRSQSGNPTTTPTKALWALHEERPISLFWKQPDLLRHADFGRHREEVLTHLDTLGQRPDSSPRVALALSFACLSAVRGRPDKKVALNADLFRALEDPQLVNRLIAPPGARAREATPTLDLARSVLQQCSRSNLFNKLVRTLAPGVQDHQLPVLKRYLQADEAVRNALAQTRSAQIHVEDVIAMEEGRGRGPGPQTLAMRVRDGACAQLAGGDDPLPRTSRQLADELFWDNNFREEGPGTELHELKQHFFDAMEQLGKDADVRGPLNSAYRYGLAGADRHLLADEEAKLFRLRDAPELDGFVQDVQDRLLQLLNDEKAAMPGPNAKPSDNAVRVIARLIALEAWTPEHRDQLSLADIVQGHAHEIADFGTEAPLVASACARFIGSGHFDQAEGIRENASSLMQGFTLSQMVLSGDLMEKVRAEMQGIRLGFGALGDLANECGVEVDAAAQDVLDRACRTIDAKTQVPQEHTPLAASAMLQSFLGEVYFGNHIKLSNIAGGGLSARGTAVNIASYLNPAASLASQATAPGSSMAPAPASDSALDSILSQMPLLARGDLRVEGSVENVVRAGAATHGGEFFLGKDVKRRLAAGGGFHVGRTALGESGTLGRLAGGVDTLPYSYDRSNYEGVMFRVGRMVREEVNDPREPRFVQNEPEVRETMSGLARTMFERARDARDSVSREQILEDIIGEFGPHGLSMTLMKQESSAHRSEASLGMGLSATTGTLIGGRFGIGGSGAVEKGWRTNVSEMDATGSYRINNLRTGWFERQKVSLDTGANLYGGPGGPPATTLAGATWSLGEAGGSVRVRAPVHDGSIVPEKTFSDTETPDKNLFKEYVLSDRQKWDDLFAYQHRHLPAEEAQQKGRDRTDAFLYKMESLREENHVYYARERLHPEVAERINDWAGVEALVPHDMAPLNAELVAVQKRLASDDRSWGAASLIAYEKNVQQDGPAGSLVGVKAANVSTVEGEREIIFDTIGWPNLRQRERENPSPHLDE